MKTTAALILLSLFAPLGAFAAGADNFDDNKKDIAKWDTDIVQGPGQLQERNHRLEFVCNNQLGTGETYWPWKLERLPVNANWTVQIDTFNSTAPSGIGQVNSGGLTLLHPTNGTSEVYLELYGVPGGKGFDANLETDGTNVGNADDGVFTTGAVSGAVRMEYDSATKVVTCLYDTNSVDGYQWVQIASFGLAGANGTTANTDWGLTTNQQMTVLVYGYAEITTVASGQLSFDNFAETGGVAPVGPATVPVGSFQFAFPTNNLSLTAIACIAGNYSGIIPQGDRPYTLDVTQDEQGKVQTIGTVDGVTDSTGSSQLASDIGKVTTVHGKPTVQSKGSFGYIADGIAGKSKGTATIPLEIVDIGGGSNGLIGTATGQADALGVPLTFKNTPVAAPETPDMQANIRKSWILTLDISKKTVKGKEITVASAVLTLPNGDTISYPEKKVKYSATKGYKLGLKKGTNTTVIPNRADKKSSIAITGLLFTKQGDTWQPTGGTIAYKFLGQKGTANLLDFTGSD